jgi:copper chaperone CopZ
MTYTYRVDGMTCNNCSQKVQECLLNIKGVKGVNVNLETHQAEITMEHHIPTGTLQEALNGTKYIIAEDTHHSSNKVSAGEEDPVTLKTYLPIFLIFGYITLVSLVIQGVNGVFNTEEWMRHFMAGFFLVFSFFKLLNIPAFAMSYSSYDIIAKRWIGYGYIYPFIELAIGIALLIPSISIPVYGFTLLVMTISIIGVIQSMLRKSRFQCACLGAIFKLPLSKITLVEDALMIVMSAASIAFYFYSSSFQI